MTFSVTGGVVTSSQLLTCLIVCSQSRLEELPEKRALSDKLSWPERKFRPLDKLMKINENLRKVWYTAFKAIRSGRLGR